MWAFKWYRCHCFDYGFKQNVLPHLKKILEVLLVTIIYTYLVKFNSRVLNKIH